MKKIVLLMFTLLFIAGSYFATQATATPDRDRPCVRRCQDIYRDERRVCEDLRGEAKERCIREANERLERCLRNCR